MLHLIFKGTNLQAVDLTPTTTESSPGQGWVTCYLLQLLLLLQVTL